jgi:hypothetical protein
MLILLSVLLQSCIVLKEEYFFPSSDGGRVIKESCRGKVGVDNQLVFEFENVTVTFDAWEYKSITRLGIGIDIYEGGEVVWPSSNIKVNIVSGEKDLVIDNFRNLRRTGDEIVSKEYLVNTSMKNTWERKTEGFYSTLVVSDESLKEINVAEIKIIVNGSEITIPFINFKKQSGMFLHPLNC